MATGASTADVAIVLVDARKGILDQTRRHTCIAALLGIRTVIAAVNKMDSSTSPRKSSVATAPACRASLVSSESRS